MTALPFLTEIVVRTALIAAGTAAVLWMLRIHTPSVRHGAWTAVVVAMLLMPLVLAGQVRMSLPVLAPAPPKATETSLGSTGSPADTLPAPATPNVVLPTDFQDATPFLPQTPRYEWLFGVYFAGAWLLLLRLVIGTIQANRLRRSAVVQNGRLTSDRCVTPITLGWLRPALVLPRGWDRWSPDQLAVVLTHEREHARRRDPLVQWLALLNRSIFWFHPLAWWLERRLATLAEEACDAAVIAEGHSPERYSEYLLDMARLVSGQQGRVRMIGMAMPGNGLAGRLRLILRGFPNMRISRLRLTVTVACCAGFFALFAAGTLAERQLPPPSFSPDQEKAAAAMPITFDVVAIRPCTDQAPTGRGGNARRGAFSPGYALWACETLSELVELAYGGGSFPHNSLHNTVRVPPNVRPDFPKRVRGGPSWVDEDRFQIEMKLSGDVTDRTGSARVNQVRDALGPPLRAMLEDRFKLKVRKATEQKPMYAMTVAPGGLKINQTAPQKCPEPSCGSIRRGGRHGANVSEAFTDITFADFAVHLSQAMDRYVLDKTGAEGRFSFKLLYAPDDTTPGDIQFAKQAAEAWAGLGLRTEPTADSVKADGPTIFKALESLGLRLDRTTGPAEYLLIERAERPRSDVPTSEPTPTRLPAGKPVSVAVADGSEPRPQRQAPDTPSTPPMQIRYEAVSIRPCEPVPGSGRGSGTSPRFAITPGYVSWGCVSLAELVENAWGGAGRLNSLLNTLPGRPGSDSDGPQRIRGGPSWARDERFAIEIRITGDTTNTTGSIRHAEVNRAMTPALRAMLEDRFQLKVRTLTEERPMYALTVAPGGHKLKPLAAGDCVPWKEGSPGPRPTRMGLLDGKWICGVVQHTLPLALQARRNGGEDLKTLFETFVPNRRIEGYGVTLSDFALNLSSLMDRYVLDRTGIAGEFMFAVEYTHNDNTPRASWGLSADAAPWPSANTIPAAVGRDQNIFRALEALGLRLEPTRGPGEYLVIDSAQRPTNK